MSNGVPDDFLCARCGKPVMLPFIAGGRCWHEWCLNPPALTEEDVRRIVREEMSAQPMAAHLD